MRMAWTMLKITVVAPIPSETDAIAATVNSGFEISCLIAYPASCLVRSTKSRQIRILISRTRSERSFDSITQ